MKNKLPHDSDFEQFVRRALQKTDDAPDENTWENIATRQKSRNFWLRLRHYALHLGPVIIGLMLAVGGWKYFSAEPAPASETPAPNPALQQEQADVADPAPYPGIMYAPVKTVEKTGMAKAPLAAHLKSSVPVTSVRFDAEEGLRYENPLTGTAVFIPAHSLVYADGKPVQGEVAFELREYRSIPDFLASGLPMHYNDERGSYFFNSGGMFDLRVNQDGEQLKLAAGQTCDVRFRSTHKLTQPSLFYFDETECAWKYQPNPAFTTADLPPVATDETVVRDNRGLLTACIPGEMTNLVRPEDKEAAAKLQTAVQTGYEYAFGKKNMPGWFRKHPTWSNEQLLTGLERSAVRMKRHKDTDDMFFPEDANNLFTELKAFKDCYFVINSGLGGKKSFTKEEFDSYWERFSVVQQNGALCYVSFFGKQGLLQFYATLTGSTENSDFDADKVIAEYVRLRDERQQNFEKQANAWRNFLRMAHVFQEPEEWCMDAFTWFDYFDANLPLMRKRYAALKEQGLADDASLAAETWKNWGKRLRDIKFDNISNKRSLDRKMGRGEGLDYALQVAYFGAYNCDQIYNLWWRGQKVEFLMAAYMSADGRRIVPKMACAIEKTSGRFLNPPRSEHMVNLPGRHIDIVVMDINGRYYRLPGDRYARLDLKDQKSYTFVVEDVTEKTHTPRDWADLLEI